MLGNMANSILNINNYFLNSYAIPYFIVGMLTLWEGVFILIQNRKSLINLSYMLSCSAVALWLVGVGMIYSSMHGEISIIWAKYFSFLGVIFITPTIYFFSVCWQTTLVPTQGIRKRLVSVIFNFTCALILYFVCISSDFFIRGLWKYPWGFYPKAGIAYFLLIGWFYILMMLSIKNFIYVYREEKIPIRRKQAKLIIIAFSIAFIGSLEFLPNYGIALYLLAFIPVFFCITVVGYSIIRYKLMDIETVVHKTVAWLFTNAALIVPLIVLFYSTRFWYMRLNTLGVLSFLGVVLLVFLFFVNVFRPKIDHFFQRRKYDLEEISSQFIENLVHLKGFGQLIWRIESVIADTLYPQQTDIFIYNDDTKKYLLANTSGKEKELPKLDADNEFLRWLITHNKIVYREFVSVDPKYIPIKEAAENYFAITRSTVVIPLVLNKKLLGMINLGKKANLKRYSALDFNFLTVLKNQSVIAISNSLLYENMEDQVRERTQELMEVQKQLVQVEKLATMGTLAGGVAHEINNPLTAILTNVQMLLSDDSLNDRLDRESLELIEEATKRCRTIVQKLMLYARKPLESAEVSNVELSDVLRNVISFLGYQLEQENIKIITQINKDNYYVRGRRNELEQVLTNLILNAKDAIRRIKKYGNIYISFSKNNQGIKIDIKDEGAGIPKEAIPKIFDPFFTTKDVGRGLGLGLSICQAIVEKHNGMISVQSEPNKGSIFTIQLPKVKEKSQSKSKVRL